MIKTIEDGYIIQVQKEGKADAEYDSFLEFFATKPTAPSGYEYRLTEAMEWELVVLPPPPTDYDISDTEALNIITKGYETE